MKTFRFTVPSPGLTRQEKQGKKKTEKLEHSDYIRAFVGFSVLSWALSFSLGFFAKMFPNDNVISGMFFLIAVILCTYFSFFWATKRLLVEKLKVEPTDED